jgi:hypothetical protein
MKMVEYIKANSKTTSNTVRALINGPTVKYTKVAGQMASSTEKASSSILKELSK